MTGIDQHFIEQSRAYLISEYMPKIRRCIATISEDDLWWRPNPHANSIGNLLVHLAGNIRQWVVSGIGGEPDIRERQKEFDADGGLSKSDALERLETTMREVDRVLADLDPGRLLERRVIQGNELMLFDALYHAVEHFGMHTGQIIYMTKLRTGADLKFYAVEGGLARPNW